MADSTPRSKMRDQIDENLKRIYDETLHEDIPDRLTQLLLRRIDQGSANPAGIARSLHGPTSREAKKQRSRRYGAPIAIAIVSRLNEIASQVQLPVDSRQRRPPNPPMNLQTLPTNSRSPRVWLEQGTTAPRTQGQPGSTARNRSKPGSPIVVHFESQTLYDYGSKTWKA